MFQVDIEINMPSQSSGPDEAPRFTMPLRDMTINDGEKAVLKVCFQGRPSPTITWFFNSKPIQPTADFKVYQDCPFFNYLDFEGHGYYMSCW